MGLDVWLVEVCWLGKLITLVFWWVEGGVLQTNNHWRVWGGLAVSRPHWVCPRSGMCAFPVYTAQAPGCSIASGPCVACGSSFRVLHKSADSVGPEFCAFSCPSSSGSQELVERTLPRCSAPYPLVVPASVSAHPVRCTLYLFWEADFWLRPGGCQPSRISGSLWLESGSLFAVW